MKVLVRQEGFIPNDQQASIELRTRNALLLKFLVPFGSSGKIVEYAVVQPRHSDASFDCLEKGKIILCNLTAVSRERAVSDDPLDLSWWRGGNAVITDVLIL